jgi:nitrous oxidase accessory protein NosD
VRDNAKGRIDFRMLCNKSSLGVADVVKTSFGYSSFTPYRQGYRVEYYQECRVMNNHLAKIYLESSKDEILKYFTGYKTYLLKIAEVPAEDNTVGIRIRRAYCECRNRGKNPESPAGSGSFIGNPEPVRLSVQR